MNASSIWLDRCVPGMRVAETITNRYMAVVVNEGTILNAQIIEKLKNINVMKIRVHDDSDKEIENNSFEAVKKEYGASVDKIKTVLMDITAGKSLDIAATSNVSDAIFDRRDDVTGVLSCLNQVRDSDEYTYSHCLNVSFICLFIAKWMNYPDDSLYEVVEAGLLHDVGKCRIPNEILNKPAVLTDEEYGEMKKHTVFGYEILSKTAGVKPSTSLAALEHHEKNNGKGYPLGLNENRIHQFGKIAAVADIYDAMTSNRVYHKRTSPFQVFRYLEDLTYGSLDPNIVIPFISNLAGYYIGDKAMLSDGREGRVVFINPRSVSRPVVQTGDDIVNLEDPSNKELIVSELM